MGYKYFGRLAGSSLGKNAISTTAARDRLKPFADVAPATKFLSYGEDASSAAVNRGLAALSTNTDFIMLSLDAPTTQEDILEPYNSGGLAPYGYSSLAGLVHDTPYIDLASGASAPPVWVYVGLHKEDLGNYIQAEMVENGVAPFQSTARPTDVQANSAASSYFISSSYPGSAYHSELPRICPTPVRTGLAPYGSSSKSVDVARWDTDGCYLSAYSWSSLFMRPGCFVQVSDSDAAAESRGYRGMYRIAAITGSGDQTQDKAVLVNAFHRVTMQDDIGASLNPGDRVYWKARNSGDVAYSAYVMHVVGRHAYLGTITGSDDLSDPNNPTAHRGGTTQFRRAAGSVGLYDTEANATQSASLVTGMQLNNDGSWVGTVDYVQPAGYPVSFHPGNVTGVTVVPCSPPGFLLNPYLVFGNNLPVGGTGDYRIRCRTLTTHREQMMAGGVSSTRSNRMRNELGFTDAQQHDLMNCIKLTKVGYQPTVLDVNVSDVASVPFGPTAQVLGLAAWVINLVCEDGPATAEGNGLTHGMRLTFTYTDSGTEIRSQALVLSCAGNQLVISELSTRSFTEGASDHDIPTSQWPGMNRIVAGSSGSETIIQGNTFRVDSIDNYPALIGMNPLEELLASSQDTVTISGSTVSYGTYNTNLQVGSILRFYANGDVWCERIVTQTDPGSSQVVVDGRIDQVGISGDITARIVGGPFVPGTGLSAAYHAQFDSSPMTRGRAGMGNVIDITPNRPVTYAIGDNGVNPSTGLSLDIPMFVSAKGVEFPILYALSKQAGAVPFGLWGKTTSAGVQLGAAIPIAFHEKGVSINTGDAPDTQGILIDHVGTDYTEADRLTFHTSGHTPSNGDALGAIGFTAIGQSKKGAIIKAVAAGNWVDNTSYPTQLDFYTTQPGETSPYPHLTIRADGRVTARDTFTALAYGSSVLYGDQIGAYEFAVGNDGLVAATLRAESRAVLPWGTSFDAVVIYDFGAATYPTDPDVYVLQVQVNSSYSPVFEVHQADGGSSSRFIGLATAFALSAALSDAGVTDVSISLDNLLSLNQISATKTTGSLPTITVRYGLPNAPLPGGVPTDVYAPVADVPPWTANATKVMLDVAINDADGATFGTALTVNPDLTLEANMRLQREVRFVNATTTVTEKDYLIVMVLESGAATVVLPTINSTPASPFYRNRWHGRELAIKVLGGGSVTVDPGSGASIDLSSGSISFSGNKSMLTLIYTQLGWMTTNAVAPTIA